MRTFASVEEGDRAIAGWAYHFSQERGSPYGSPEEDWYRPELIIRCKEAPEQGNEQPLESARRRAQQPPKTQERTALRDRVTGSAMVDQWANPECKRKLRNLRDGKIYLFELHTVTGGTRLEYFWLCGECLQNHDPGLCRPRGSQDQREDKLRKKWSQT